MKKAKKPALTWDDAIAEAEELIRIAKRRIFILEGAINTFRLCKRDGLPWPSRADTE